MSWWCGHGPETQWQRPRHHPHTGLVVFRHLPHVHPRINCHFLLWHFQMDEPTNPVHQPQRPHTCKILLTSFKIIDFQFIKSLVLLIFPYYLPSSAARWPVIARHAFGCTHIQQTWINGAPSLFFFSNQAQWRLPL